MSVIFQVFFLNFNSMLYVLSLKLFTLCEYSAKNTTRLPTSTQKTPITTTLSTSKTNNTKNRSKATTTPSTPTTKYTNIRKTTTEGIPETTTQINPLGKDPRFGDNNITGTETPDDFKSMTSSVESLITAITDSTTNEDTTFTTEYYQTETTPFGVIPSDHNTKRPRIETTLEIEDERNWNISATTEPMETTTNLVLTAIDETSDTNEEVSVHKSCKSTKKDCGTNEICIKKECFKKCETNGNVTKSSDDCVKGTPENN